MLNGLTLSLMKVHTKQGYYILIIFKFIYLLFYIVKFCEILKMVTKYYKLNLSNNENKIEKIPCFNRILVQYT